MARPNARPRDGWAAFPGREAAEQYQTAVEDYVNRGLRLGELYELAGKYGHRLQEEDEQPTRVFVPGSLRRQ